jgi:poly(A) polymerase
VFRLMSHPRFRAAFDFLLLRAHESERMRELGEWWAHAQQLPPEMLAAALGGGGVPVHETTVAATAPARKRRRRRKPGGRGKGDSGGA